MGFFSEYIKPTTHTVRHDAHKKDSGKCGAPGCGKRAKADGSCGKAGHANQQAIRKGWLE